MLEFTCPVCSSEFKKPTAEYNRNLKSNPDYKPACSAKCTFLFKKQETYFSTECANCSKSLTRRIKEVSDTGNFFCSRSCACIFNNKAFPKRKPRGLCSNCNKPCASSRKHCSFCIENKVSFSSKTIEETLPKNSKRASIYSAIRDHARKELNKNNIPKKCRKCSYDTHVECCHIVPIKDFPLSALISEVNCISNLIYLCPNCHWELDNKRFDIQKLLLS